ncbi:MAG: hypothetical protein RL141_895 [Candidatus Parcubacteria bacterium]|jgi:hypothetical protein
MRLSPPLFAALALILFGAGCSRTTAYTPAPPTGDIEVVPSAEGARASTGGQPATITDALRTEQLVSALPPNHGGWVGGEVAEIRNPIPLPDGTRAEYAGVTREYSAGANTLRVTLTDTRGIPALTAFLDSYEARNTGEGYRAQIPIGTSHGWITYTYGDTREAGGSGSLTLLYRNRFLIQCDGSVGISAETIAQFVEKMDFETLQ